MSDEIKRARTDYLLKGFFKAKCSLKICLLVALVLSVFAFWAKEDCSSHNLLLTTGVRVKEEHRQFIRSHIQFVVAEDQLNPGQRQRYESTISPWSKEDAASVVESLAWIFAQEPAVVEAALNGHALKLVHVSDLPPRTLNSFAQWNLESVAESFGDGIFLDSKEISSPFITQTMLHELAHIVDWRQLISHCPAWTYAEYPKLVTVHSLSDGWRPGDEIPVLKRLELPSIYAASNLSEDFAETLACAVIAKSNGLNLYGNEKLALSLVSEAHCDRALQYSREADYQFQSGDQQLAIRLIGKGIKAKPSPELKLQYGFYVMDFGTHSEKCRQAEALLKMAGELKKSSIPKFESIWNELGASLECFAMSNFEDIQYLQRLAAVDESMSKRARLSIRLQVSAHHIATGDFVQAEKYAGEAVAIDPKSARAHRQLADILTCRDAFGDAISQYKAAADLGPTLYGPECDYNCAWCYHMLHEEAKAECALLASLKQKRTTRSRKMPCFDKILDVSQSPQFGASN